MKKIYMIDRLDNSILVNGEKVQLPKGMYIQPGFSSKKEALKYTNGKFTISEYII